MKLTIRSAKTDVSGQLGPMCIACGNTRWFWIQSDGDDELCELANLPDGEIRIVACGRCQSRRSIVIAHVD
jgi:hypothetical protein